ncbi:MAG: GNAT family N-acetyltransferase [Lachnospiraceae bacterium]
MEFRKADIQDTNELRTIARNSEAYWGYDELFMEKFDSDFNISKDFISEYSVYLATEDDNVICFWGIKNTQDNWELEYFYIARAWIGKGYGKKMWSHFTEWCREHQVSQVSWVTSPHAIGFYQNMGAVRGADVRSAIDGRPIPRFTLV